LTALPSLAQLDEARLVRAVEVAHQSIGLSEPNPRVGCVLFTAAGAFAGEGNTRRISQG